MKQTLITKLDLQLAELYRQYRREKAMQEHIRKNYARCPVTGELITDYEWREILRSVCLRVQHVAAAIRRAHFPPARPRVGFWGRVRRAVADLIAPAEDRLAFGWK